MNTPNLIHDDLHYVWHPCDQMKDYVDFPPLVIESAQGPYLKLNDGRLVIDAISSWWCKSFGHNEPRLKAALLKQAERFEHVLLANTTNDVIIALSKKLCQLTGLGKAFYACDGSSAVEIALKMSLHAQQIQGHAERTTFAALANSYHGETALTMSVSDLGLYKKPYSPLLYSDVKFIDHIPYVNSSADPRWDNCANEWPAILEQLTACEKTLCAIIVEPLLQGAGGMKIYSMDLLRRLRQWSQDHGVHLICDEILTGLGRTGLPLASQYAQIIPDFVCLGKGLTAGWLPFSAVVTSNTIYDYFYDDHETGKAFLHSHTHSGNSLAAAVALETLHLLEHDRIYDQVSTLSQHLLHGMLDVAETTKKLKNVRALGAVVAADLTIPKGITPKRLSLQIFKEAARQGALLRPLGDTLYWLPPLNSDAALIEKLRDITRMSLDAVYK